MAQSMADELVQILKGFSATFTVKISNLITFVFHHKNASSLGAIAGLAIALLCTWKYLKVPARRKKRIQKPEHISSTFSAPEDAAIGTSTAVTKGITQPTQRSDAIQEASSPFQVSVAQLVRRQLLGGRKVTCQLLGIILKETSAEELQKHVVVRPHVVDVLLELTRACDMYLFAKVLDDESEASVLAALDSVGAFTMGGLNRNKVLFYSTEAGGTSFVRQLEPDWHIDTAGEKIEQLARYIPHLLHITSFGAAPIQSNVFVAQSLEGHFALNEEN